MKTRIKVIEYKHKADEYYPQYFDPYNLICILVLSLIYLVVASIGVYFSSNKIVCYKVFVLPV